MMRVRQKFDSGRIEDVYRETRLGFEAVCPPDMVGRSVAVTAGSRGIANILQVIRAVVDTLISRVARPFIVPAMGSHGGATAEGQREVLRGYGITEEYVGAKIVSYMETVSIGRTPAGIDVRMDRNAIAADGIVVVARIKPHTDFSGPIESGIAKMLAIGLGKQHGANVCHKLGFPNM